ncbi:MAG: bifunctional [glutamine synthetase] adenylyltransferase/[glutamine synthetase]-adenylyl-L-tyrosine phosphorylase [Leucobacter sp.]
MSVDRPQHKLTDFARAGFQELGESRELFGELASTIDAPAGWLLEAFSLAADPDVALIRVCEFARDNPDMLKQLGRAAGERFAILVGASPALGDFFRRRPDRLVEILERGGRLLSEEEAKHELLQAVETEAGRVPRDSIAELDSVTALTGEAGWNALRTRYRELLAEIMLFDLLHGRDGDPTDQLEEVALSLASVATAALEGALAVARATLAAGESGPEVPAEYFSMMQFSVLALGKCGAQELNVVSDVDVIFIAETRDAESFDVDKLLRISTRLASEMMRVIHDPALEPPLWEVDANLRPEGRQGALVRTLGSMMHYYERWAKAWEFQALLKARAAAGDLELGQKFIDATRPMVWSSRSREGFVGSVQRMRQRVTEYIADDDVEVEIKLGPGGLRDIEFSVQLLQLVHGQHDERLHLSATLPALRALVDGGYVARSDGERLASDYRRLRVLEHRLQLRYLRRTAIMPRDEENLRVVARASQLAPTAKELLRLWEAVKREVRELHLKIFYAPLLSAVAALPEEGLVLGSEEARARLSTIGFRDPDGAMRHLAALTQGTSRRARIQRNLMPVMLQWFAEGTDPDYGLLAFRRVSEANRQTPWYLRLLRDGTEAADRLTRVLSNSRFAAELLESIPEAVAWLERDQSLKPMNLEALREEMRALASRRATVSEVAVSLRAVHRREMLRLAMGRIVGVVSDGEVASGLDSAHTALLEGLLLSLMRDEAQRENGRPDIEIALIGMGRFGGQEMGFASDIDLIAVFRAPNGMRNDEALRCASRVVTELRRLVSDPKFSVDLDFDLRPEGKRGPLVRSLEAYRAYYTRWSLTWEAQALLRARVVAGSASLGADFIRLADEIRYPASFSENDVREVRRTKARVESERLPRGADPRRHLKLGPGGISDVEWLVQLLQLRDGAAHTELQSVSTLAALREATELGLIDEEGQETLEEAWRVASQIRSAVKLWSGRGTDVLPVAREDLEGIAGVLDLPSGRTAELEERWFTASRRARGVFESYFYGYEDERQEERERFPLV